MNKQLNIILVLAFAALSSCAAPRYSYEPYPLSGSATETAEQIKAICMSRARVAALEAKNAVLEQASRNRSSSQSYNCQTTARGYGKTYDSTCTPQGQGLAGAISKIGTDAQAKAAHSEAGEAAVRACLAEKGWAVRETCIENCN